MSTLGPMELDRLIGGDEKVFGQLFELYYVKMVQRAVVYTQDIDIAEDIVQEVFTRLWKNRSELRGAQNIEGYIYMGVRNRCLNHLEHRQVADNYFRSYVEEEPDDDSEREKYAAVMRRLFALLPEKRQEVLRMSVFESKSYAEIASALGITLNTVKDHIKKAYAFLRKEAGALL